MKSFTALALAATAAGLAVPAAAQPWQGHANRAPIVTHGKGQSVQVWQEIAELDRKIDRADRRGAVSQREAAGLHRQVADLKRDFRRLSANGLDRAEARQLAQRTDRIEQRLRSERHDRDGRRG